MRSPWPAVIGSLVAAAWWWFLARRDRSVAADFEAAWLSIERQATRVIGMVALIAAIVAATFATRSAAGADASGYLSQAKSWAEGVPLHIELLAEKSPEFRGWLATPLGWRPDGGIDMHATAVQVPTYAPGLPLLMAIPHALLGINGATAVIVASTAIAVWATGMIAGGVAGIIAALLLAFTPVFLYQSIQPMSDVPVTAAWMLSFLLLRSVGPLGPTSFLSGVACAVAVLIRPNLAPLAIVPFAFAGKRWHFAIPVAVSGMLLAVVHTFWYGSPLQSGYGSAGELFTLANFGPNITRYFGWIIATAAPLLLASVGLIRLKGDPTSRALAIFAILVIHAYLVYAVFDHWSYLRFLLPALAVFAVFAAVALAAWVARWPLSWRAPMLVAVMLAVTAYGLFVARSLDTFRLAGQLRRVEQTATFISGYSGERPVIVSGEQSGAMRYYTGMPILRWEAATPETMRAAIAAVERSGHSIYIALDAWEQELFLKKFADVAAIRLDWPPMLEAGTSHRTKVWRITDRARFLAGTQLPTVRVP